MSQKWIRPVGQYVRPKEEQEIYKEITRGEFMNPWDCEPEVERLLRLRYSDEQLKEIYKNVYVAFLEKKKGEM
jgi:hypothetical protein